MWQGIIGHDRVVESFRRSLASGRLASTYLFVGPPGVGKRALALRLAQVLLCQQPDEAALEPCGQCDSCRMAEAGSHPDLLLVSKPEEKADIPVELLIGDKEHRMRQGLCHDIGLKPFCGRRRVAIVDDGDHLNKEGANCLLKTLEEPPPRSVLILVATSAARQLPTIRSRCQIIRFAPLEVDQVADVLLARGAAGDRPQALRLAAQSGGSLERALQLADPEVQQMHDDLLEQLAAAALDGLRLARAIGGMIDRLPAKPAAARRDRLRLLIGMTIDYYGAALRAACGAPQTGDAALHALAERTVAQHPGGPELYAACLERCVDAIGHVDRNANQNAFLECWLSDLERMLAAG